RRVTCSRTASPASGASPAQAPRPRAAIAVAVDAGEFLREKREFGASLLEREKTVAVRVGGLEFALDLGAQALLELAGGVLLLRLLERESVGAVLAPDFGGEEGEHDYTDNVGPEAALTRWRRRGRGRRAGRGGVSGRRRLG